MKNMVVSSKSSRLLQRKDVERLLNHADQVSATFGVTANGARVRISNVLALATKHDLVNYGTDCRREGVRLLAGSSDEMVGETLRRHGADARKLAQLFDQPNDRCSRRKEIH